MGSEMCIRDSYCVAYIFFSGVCRSRWRFCFVHWCCSVPLLVVILRSNTNSGKRSGQTPESCSIVGTPLRATCDIIIISPERPPDTDVHRTPCLVARIWAKHTEKLLERHAPTGCLFVRRAVIYYYHFFCPQTAYRTLFGPT